MMTLKLLTISEVSDAIANLRTDAASVQERTHLIACSTLDHIREHGDYRGAVSLLNALPNGTRVKALAYWFRNFSNNKFRPKFNKDSKTWDADLSKDRSPIDFDMIGAEETSYADLTSERDPVSVTVKSMLRNLERNATNMDNHDGTDVPKVEPAARELASKLIAFCRDNGIAA